VGDGSRGRPALAVAAAVRTVVTLGTATPGGGFPVDGQARHGFLGTLTVPAGSYPGQDAPIASAGSWSFIMAPPPDDVAWRLARALHLGAADLARRLPQARQTAAASTAAAAPSPALIHPGALPCLREIGVAP